MPEVKRRLKKIDVSFISLVDRGANGKQIIFKSANSPTPNVSKVISIIKTDEEKRLVYGTVYEPDTADTQGDIADVQVIEKAAHEFLAKLNNKNVDTQHDFNPDDGAVVESFILRAADPMFPETKIGSWVVAIKVAKDETWALIKSGEITGLSLAGLAVVEELQKQNFFTLDKDAEESFFARLSKSIKEGIANLKKDFNSNFNNDVVRRMGWALTDAIGEALNDETVVDKKAAILANVEQFKAALEKIDFNIGKTINANTGLTKAGKIFNAKNLQSLKEMKGMIETMIAQMEEDETKIQKQKNGDKEMTPEEIQAIVNTAIEEGLKPVNESIEKMKTEVNEKATAIEQRLEKVEKASPGSAQAIVDSLGIKKEEGYTGPGWLS